MSFLNAMQNTQKFLLNYTQNGKPYEILAAILAARQFNTSIMESDFGPGNQKGKLRTLKVNYYPPVCSDAGDGTENICDPGIVLQPMQDWFDITRKTASDVYQLNPEDIRYTEEGYTFSDHARQQILSVLPTVRKKLATAVATLLYANKGVLYDGNTTQLLPRLYTQASGYTSPDGLWEIERQFREAGMREPFIVGGTDVFYWRKAVDIGGLNDRGQNVAQMGRTNVYYDTLINDAAADANYEHVLAFDPQYLKFVTWSANAGIFATDLQNIDAIDAMYARGSENIMKGALADPLTGLLWDLNVHYDICANDGAGAFKFQWILRWDIIFMPPRVCNVQGVNGIFHYLTCKRVATTCESGSPITPASSDTYDYDTSGLTFPLYVDKLELGGQTTYPRISVADVTAMKNMFNANFNGITFTVSGANVRYTGYSAISGQINDATNITFTT